MKVKNVLMGLIAGALSAQVAHADVAANFNLTTDYVWLGQTQTGHDAAIQGGLEYNHDVGLSLGTWVSNANSGGETTLENEVYAKYAYSFGDVGVGAGAKWNNYIATPKEGTYKNFMEYNVFATYKFLKFDVMYIDDLWKLDTSLMRYSLGANFDVAMGLNLGLGVAYNDFDSEVKAGQTNYMDWMISLGKTYDLATVSLNYTDTDRKLKAGTREIEIRDRSMFAAVSKNF